MTQEQINAPRHTAERSGASLDDDSFRCDRCGNIETPPYADGDTCCMCGGTFHPYNAEHDARQQQKGK